MYVIASLCILFSSANNFLISSVIFVISNSPFHFYYVVAFYTFSRDFRCLGRDSRQAEFGFSTHFADFPCFRQRFPDGRAWFLYPFRRLSLFQVEIPGRRKLVSLPISPIFPVLGRDFQHHAPPRRTPPRRTPPRHAPTTAHPTTSRPTTARPTTAHSTTAQPATASHTATMTHHTAVSLLISLLLLYFIREIIDFNEHQPRIKRG